MLETTSLLFISALLIQKKRVPRAFVYFLTQSWASLFILGRFFSTSALSSLISLTGLLVKLGGAPLHTWYPSVAKELTWKDNFTLSTVIKILPLYLLFTATPLVDKIRLGVLNCVVGAYGGLRIYCCRKIIAYSSVRHLGWIILRIRSVKLTAIYFGCYMILNFWVVNDFEKANIFYLRERRPAFNLIIRLLSLRGLPPLLGFVPKWVLLRELALTNTFFIRVALLTRIFSLFFYMRTILKSFFFAPLNSFVLTIITHSVLCLPLVWSIVAI